MRIRCPYCEKRFALYPLPASYGIKCRRAGRSACATSFVLVFVAYLIVGPDVAMEFVRGMTEILTPRSGFAVAATLMIAPFIFMSLAVYDRTVPRFGPPVSDELHCLKCGCVLKGLAEPKCPECGERI